MITVLLYTLGVLIFAFAILASIGLHELGHMIPAKKFGGKVTQYFIGFGPTVWSRQVGETEYGVKAIPLGGYVKIIGMLPPGAEDILEEGDAEDTPDGAAGRVMKVRKSNTGMFTQLISDARAAEWELVQPEDSDRLFYKMTWWKKVVVMAGGPTVNLVIAFGIFAALFATVGNAGDPAVETTVQRVHACVVSADEAGRACTAEEVRTAPSPAYTAGMKAGDRILSFNGTTVSSWDQVQDLVRDNGTGQATLVVERDGHQLTIRTETAVRPPARDGDPVDERVGFLGVSPRMHATTGGPLYTLGQMGDMTVGVVKAIGTLPVKVWGVAKAIVGLEERDPEGPVSIVGGGRLAGETASHDELPGKDKAISLLMLIAGFNFFIGMFNFVPLLPLDGGHIASALWEAVRRAWARTFRRPDPGYVDAARLLPIAYVVASALLVMGVVLIVGDLVRPVHLES